MSRLRLLLAFALVLICAIALAHTNTACDSFEEPCRVTANRIVLADPTIATLPSIELTHAKDRAVALWVRRELPDGGVDGGGAGDAGDGGDGGDGGNGGDAGPDALFPVLSAIDLAVVDATKGGLAFRTKIQTPDELRTRQDSIGGLDVIVEDGAFLLHWIETRTTTDPDGRLRKAAATKIAYAIGDGAAAPAIATGAPFAPARAACEHCVITASTVALVTESIMFLRFDRDVIDPIAGAPLPVPTFAALRIRRDGTVIDENVPWLALPTHPLDGGGLVAATNPDLAAYVDDLGRIVVTTGGFTWLVDTTLHVFSGPVELPKGNDVQTSFNGEGEASIAWSLSPFEDGRSENDQVPRDIFTGLVPVGNFVIATRERTSRGRVLLGMDRRGADVGVLFESAGRTFFAALDSHGKKRGGDILVDGNAGTLPISELGIPSLNNQSLLFTITGTTTGAPPTYRAVTFGSGKITTTEITCDAP